MTCLEVQGSPGRHDPSARLPMARFPDPVVRMVANSVPEAALARADSLSESAGVPSKSLDCYWVGSLDFNFWEYIKGVFH